MAKVTRDEVLKLAQMSRLKVVESEIDKIASELESVLSYAERICQIEADKNFDLNNMVNKNINVMRLDEVKDVNYNNIMQQAPSVEDNYFIVPKILDGAEGL